MVRVGHVLCSGMHTSTVAWFPGCRHLEAPKVLDDNATMVALVLTVGEVRGPRNVAAVHAQQKVCVRG